MNPRSSLLKLLCWLGCLSLSSCAWFQNPPPVFPPPTQVVRDTVQTSPTAEAIASLEEPDTSRVPLPDTTRRDSVMQVADRDTADGEPWVFEGRALRATTVSGQLVHHATFPRIQHGTMRLTGDTGTYLHDEEQGTLTGNVTFEDVEVEGSSDRAIYYREARRLVATGRVELWNDSLRVAAPRLDYDRSARFGVMSGGVVGNDAGKDFSSRRAEWNQEDNELTLLGDARVEDPDGSAVEGETIVYDLVTKVAKVEGKPELVLSSVGEVETRLLADEVWLDDPDAYASGSVRVLRGDISATADSAAFFGDQNQALLLGTPEVVEPNGRLWADTLQLVFDADDALDYVEALGNAGLRYTPLDSARQGEVSEVEADRMHIDFFEGAIQFLRATRNARSRYQAAPQSSDTQGTNVAQGDTINIQMKEDEGVEWVRILGNAKGTYTFSESSPDSAVGDSVADSLSVDASVEKVDYQADEVLFTFDERMVEMFGNAQADYHPLTLTAETVRFYLDNRYLEAEGSPSLTDNSNREQEAIVGRRMDYNLDTKEGQVVDGRTKAENGFVTARQLRQIGDGDFLARGGRMTSCDLADQGQDPHFHFGSERMRIYLDDKVVAKPITLYIRDVPIFGLPFYVFPIRKGRQSGFLTPQFGFGVGGEESRFIKRLGYYWATNDYMDVEARMDYYESDSKFVPALGYRYKWLKHDLHGNANLRHLRSARQSLWDFSLGHWMTWNDWRITATGEYRDQDFRSEEAITGNIGQAVDRILKNSLDFSRRMNFGSLRLSLKSQRDLAVDAGDGRDDNVITETLPEYSLSLNTRTLGREPDEEGEGGFLPFFSTTNWSFSSSGRRRGFRDEVTRIDSTGGGLDTLVTQESTSDWRVDHRLSLSDRRKLLGVISVGPSFNVTEHWVDREFSAADTSMGFARAATWNASLNANTQLFGTIPGPGPVESLRHVVKPNVSLQYAPNTDGLLYEDESGIRRNRYPGVSGFERKSLALSLNQDFLAKVRTEEGVKRVDLMSWNLSSSYDFLEDDNRFSPVRSQMSLRRILGVTLNFNSTHDPYKQFQMDQFNADGAFGFRGSLPGSGEQPSSAGDPGGGELTSSLEGLGGDVFDPDRKATPSNRDPSLSYRANFSLSFAGSRNFQDELETRSSLRSSFQVQLTPNWGVNYSNVWRISEGEVSGERLSLSRNLHCWEAHLEGNRVGDNLSFYFRINIRELQDIKVEQGRQGAEFGGLSRILP